MKKLILFILMIPITVWAADQNEICRRNTLVMAVLQNEVNGIEAKMNRTSKKWAVRFNYDLFAGTHPNRVTAYVTKGRTTCNMIDYKSSDNGLSSNNGTASTGDANTFLKASAPDVGVNCWCKMDGPVTSWWTYLKKYEDSGDKSGRKICEEQCTTLCATAFAKNTNVDGGNTGILIRNALLNKIW